MASSAKRWALARKSCRLGSGETASAAVRREVGVPCLAWRFSSLAEGFAGFLTAAFVEFEFGGNRGEGLDVVGADRLTEGCVEGAETELGEGLVDGVDPRSVEGVAEAIPGMLGGGAEDAPVHEDGVLVAT